MLPIAVFLPKPGWRIIIIKKEWKGQKVELKRAQKRQSATLAQPGGGGNPLPSTSKEVFSTPLVNRLRNPYDGLLTEAHRDT